MSRFTNEVSQSSGLGKIYNYRYKNKKKAAPAAPAAPAPMKNLDASGGGWKLNPDKYTMRSPIPKAPSIKHKPLAAPSIPEPSKAPRATPVRTRIHRGRPQPVSAPAPAPAKNKYAGQGSMPLSLVKGNLITRPKEKSASDLLGLNNFPSGMTRNELGLKNKTLVKGKQPSNIDDLVNYYGGATGSGEDPDRSLTKAETYPHAEKLAGASLTAASLAGVTAAVVGGAVGGVAKATKGAKGLKGLFKKTKWQMGSPKTTPTIPPGGVTKGVAKIGGAKPAASSVSTPLPKAAAPPVTKPTAKLKVLDVGKSTSHDPLMSSLPVSKLPPVIKPMPNSTPPNIPFRIKVGNKLKSIKGKGATKVPKKTKWQMGSSKTDPFIPKGAAPGLPPKAPAPTSAQLPPVIKPFKNSTPPKIPFRIKVENKIRSGVSKFKAGRKVKKQTKVNMMPTKVPKKAKVKAPRKAKKTDQTKVTQMNSQAAKMRRLEGTKNHVRPPKSGHKGGTPPYKNYKKLTPKAAGYIAGGAAAGGSILYGLNKKKKK